MTTADFRERIARTVNGTELAPIHAPAVLAYSCGCCYPAVRAAYYDHHCAECRRLGWPKSCVQCGTRVKFSDAQLCHSCEQGRIL